MSAVGVLSAVDVGQVAGLECSGWQLATSCVRSHRRVEWRFLTSPPAGMACSCSLLMFLHAVCFVVLRILVMISCHDVDGTIAMRVMSGSSSISSSLIIVSFKDVVRQPVRHLP